jgi:hypothetical protein
MIYESSYWKEPLLKTARWLVGVRLSERTRERTYVRIERELFVSFYAIRKLFDTLKISDQVKKATTELEWHPNRRAVHHMNCEHLDLLYDFNTSKKEVRDIVFLCNQFVHSFVFVPYEENAKIGGFFVSSDRDRNKKLYRVRLEQVTTLFRLVGRDYPASMFFRFNYKTGVHDAQVE